ncbi:MAG: hypothetical protein CMN17_12660 [Roseovarius sp.]|nr:hypothetical protein [Roseovarius sp.]MBK44802.1 hypothetical protein [Roseovarius sp.]|tara:strand:+ start:2894 stop:3469 length:576 start_codon:yes stop_codon:yes gene_type:complete
MEQGVVKRLEFCLAAIDDANSHDPDRSEGQPAAQLYGQRMSAELARLFPDASEPLQIAARGQHIERWVMKRQEFPEGRAGYLAWRTELAKHHATRVGEIMKTANYDAQDIAKAQKMLLKDGLKRDAEVQALEDVICVTFLKWYFAPFAPTQNPEKLDRIVARTARKMSEAGRARVLQEFELPEAFAAHFRA